MKYLIEVILIQLLFFGLYETLLKKETFFHWNRYFLLFSFAASFVLPFLVLPELRTEVALPTESFVPDAFLYTLEPVAVEANASNAAASYSVNWMLLLYVAGCFVAFILFVKKLGRILQMRAQGTKSQWKGVQLIELRNSSEAFSFFRWVFIGDEVDEDQRQQILEHEMVHIEEVHSLDLLFFELARIFFWFNPLVYVFQNRLSEVHEFTADKVCAKEDKQTAYLHLLGAAFGVSHVSLINQFAAGSLLRKRIHMLHKKPSSQKRLLRFAIVFPLLAGILTYTSCDLVSSDDKEGESDVERIETEFVAADVPTYDKPPQFTACEIAENQRDCFNAQMTAFIQSRLKYPETAKAQGLEGQVQVVFKIDAQGDVQDIKAQSSHPEFEAEAKRIISLLPRFIPGTKNGKAVAVPYAVPISFQLNNEVTTTTKVSTTTEVRKTTVIKNQAGGLGLDKGPIYPGCESAEDEFACFSQSIQEYIVKNLKYPETAEKEGAEDRVLVYFLISKSGKRENIRIQSRRKDFEEEVRRLIDAMPQFTAAQKDGEAVPLPFSIPIDFRLN